MSALPPHVATADEPIPASDGYPEQDLPDMRAAPPIVQMIEWLNALDDDVEGYLRLWRGLLTTIGNSVSFDITREGVGRLMVGGPVDAQIRHRSRWMHYLVEDLDRKDGRRELLGKLLCAEGRYVDNRRLGANAEAGR